LGVIFRGSTRRPCRLARSLWLVLAGFAGTRPEPPGYVIDVRYSMLPNRIDPLWGIQLSPGARADYYSGYVTTRELSASDRRVVRHAAWRRARGGACPGARAGAL